MKKAIKVISFIEVQKYIFVFSFLIFFSGILAFLYHKGFYYGIDFSGGVQIIIDLKEKINLKNLKKKINSKIHVLKLGKDDGQFIFKFIIDKRNFNVNDLKKDLEEAILKNFPNNIQKQISINYEKNSGFYINIINQENKNDIITSLNTLFHKNKVFKNTNNSKVIRYQLGLSDTLSYFWIINPLKKSFGNLEILEENIYEPNQGQILIYQSWLIIAFVFLLILLYIGLRFQLKYAMAAILSLIHDVCIILSFVLIFGKEIDSLLIVAILTIIGYSLNDTIVIFDRIRENYQNDEMEIKDYIYQINKSITLSLKRTLITSLTTFFVVFSILIFGGKNLNNLAFGLLIGIISGTYSSIFIASPFLVLWEKIKMYRYQLINKKIN